MVGSQINIITFQFRIASLPGIAGTRFSLLKCVGTHEATHPYTINQKKVKYSTKSATRIFLRGRPKFLHGLRGPNASRFSSPTNAKLFRNVEEGYRSVPVRFAFPKHALVARNLRKTSEFSIQFPRKKASWLTTPASFQISTSFN